MMPYYDRYGTVLESKMSEFYVVYKSHNTRTGGHTHREGPYTEQEANLQAEAYARWPHNSAVWITWGTPYFKKDQYKRIK